MESEEHGWVSWSITVVMTHADSSPLWHRQGCWHRYRKTAWHICVWVHNRELRCASWVVHICLLKSISFQQYLKSHCSICGIITAQKYNFPSCELSSKYQASWLWIFFFLSGRSLRRVISLIQRVSFLNVVAFESLFFSFDKYTLCLCYGLLQEWNNR